MGMKRRSFLSFLGASPIAMKAAAEREAKKLSGIGSNPTSTDIFSTPGDPRPEQYEKALLNPFTRRIVEEVLYRERFRRVRYIDADLAVLRSYSLNAKVCFQRQRDVARYIESLQKEDWWVRLSVLFQ